MKKVLIALLSVVAILVIILILYTAHGRSVRETELENAMTSSMEKAMQMLDADVEYAPKSNEELIALFIQNLTLQIDSSSDLTVNILDVDYEKRLLSAEAILTYKHPNGSTGTVACTKTIIYEWYNLAQEPEYVTVQFMVEGVLYKKYVLIKDSSYLDPGVPTSDNGTFVGWKDMEGTMVNIGTLMANNDATYIAVFE